MSILFLISHTQKNRSHYEAIEATWGKGQKTIYYSDHFGIPNILKFSDSSDFSSNEEKFVNMVRYLPDILLDYEWFFVSNDDTFVNVPLLEAYTLTADPKLVHGKAIRINPLDPALQYLSGGAGRLISRDVFLHARKTIYMRHTGFSDVTFGMHLQDHEIFTQDSSLFHIDTPKKEGIPDVCVKHHLTFHYCMPDEMYRLQTLIQKEPS